MYKIIVRGLSYVTTVLLTVFVMSIVKKPDLDYQSLLDKARHNRLEYSIRQGIDGLEYVHFERDGWWYIIGEKSKMIVKVGANGWQ